MAHPGIRIADIRRRQLSDWLRRGLDLLFPPHCVVCSRMGTWFCGDCLASVEPVPQPVCTRCGEPMLRGRVCSSCRVNPLQLDGVRSVAIHGGALRQAIHHFKYQHRRELAEPLGRLLYTYWQEGNLPVDVVIPVPLHASRQRERGYNQSALLARVLANQASLPFNDRDLTRTRATAPQVGLGAEERKVNVENAFVWKGGGLSGARVLLIDDVCTTGATLEACALALRQHDADSIWALTLARPLSGPVDF
jgi:ComF family protein